MAFLRGHFTAMLPLALLLRLDTDLKRPLWNQASRLQCAMETVAAFSRLKWPVLYEKLCRRIYLKL